MPPFHLQPALSPPTGLSAAARHVSLGLWVGIFIRLNIDLLGSSPATIFGALAAMAVGFVLLPGIDSVATRLAVAVTGCLALSGAPGFLGAAPPGGVVPILGAVVVACAWGAGPVLACQSLLFKPGSTLFLLFGCAAAATVPSGLLMPLLSALLVVAWGSGAAHGRGRGSRSAPKMTDIGARTVPCLLILSPALVGFSLLRAPLLPTPAAFVGFGGALLLAVGTGSAAPRVAGAVGILTMGAVVSGAQDLGGAMRVLREFSPGAQGTGVIALTAISLFGAATGALLAAVRANPREQAVSLVLAVIFLAPALSRVPTAWAEHAGAALNTVGADPSVRQRLDAARSRMPLPFAHVGPSGPALLRGDGQHLLAELDGTVLDPESRGASAERFAGTLAGCFAAQRQSARLAGDDTGTALDALLAQEFAGIDTALPDISQMRAWADLDGMAREAWVHPSTRILELPGPFVAQAGRRSDAVVHILRNGWTDARSVLPSASSLRATKRSLNVGGVYVLSVSSTRMDGDDLLGLAHLVTEVFPGVTIWLPPVGVDAVVLLARQTADPLPWAAVAPCVQRDRQRLRRDAIRSAVDLGGLLLGDRSAIPAAEAPSGWTLPRVLERPEANPTTRFEVGAWDPATAWSADAPADDLRARHDALIRLQAVIATAAGGDMQGAIQATRDLSASAGGGRAVETLVRGYLDAARAHLARGAKEGLDSKEWAAAETALGNVRLLYPDLAEAWCVEGLMSERRGQLVRAEEAFATCAEKDTESLEALDGLARTRRARGDLIGTEEALRRAVETHPESWRAKQNLGWLYVGLGRMAAAEPLILQAVAGASRAETPAIEPHLALAHIYLATDRPSLALGEASLVLRERPSADAYALRGMARFDLNQLDTAERDFREGLALNPDSILARSGLGQLQFARGDLDGATASFKAVLALDNSNAQARENLRRLSDLGKNGE